MPTAAERRTQWSKRVNLVLTVAWLAMVPISIATGWIYSIAFIAACSIYANAASHLAAWRSDENPDADRLRDMDQKVDELRDGLDS